MKKLMIAAAIVCAAAYSHAATVSWNSGTMYAAIDAKGTPSDTIKYGSTGHKGTAYLFYFETLEAYNTAKATDVSKLYETYILDSTKVATAKTTKAPTAGGAANIKFTDAPAGSPSTPITLYGMEIFVDTDSAAAFTDVDAFVKVGFDTGSYEDDVGTTFGGLGTQQTNWTAYSAVPEPTSGLLLLFGVAGLALRRRRA